MTSLAGGIRWCDSCGRHHQTLDHPAVSSFRSMLPSLLPMLSSLSAERIILLLGRLPRSNHDHVLEMWRCLLAKLFGSCGNALSSIFQRILSSFNTTNSDTRLPEGVIAIFALDHQTVLNPRLNEFQALSKLREEETSSTFRATYYGPRGVDARRMDETRVPSNQPTEDRKSYRVADVGGPEPWKFWGVYDGHRGDATAKVLESKLSASVAGSIRQARETNAQLPSYMIDSAIKTAFTSLDRKIMDDGLLALLHGKQSKMSYAEMVSSIAPAHSGSCALLAMFDPTTATLRVACTGDSRAVLGRRQPFPSGETPYATVPLSVDQTGLNPHEVRRHNLAHPNETDAIDFQSGHLLGLGMTRAFGDSTHKWPRCWTQRFHHSHDGPLPHPKSISPPYLTAEPEVTTTTVKQHDFLILATDGLWERVSSEFAVACVAHWFQNYRQPPSWHHLGMPHTDNAATYLVWHALGGDDGTDTFVRLMSTRYPESRTVRDDITVQIVFFH